MTKKLSKIQNLLSPVAKLNQRWGFFFDFILGLLVSLGCLRILLVFSDPPGLNGYFYLKQTKTLAANFTFYFTDHSLAFAPLVLFRWLSGSELHAFQMGIVLAVGFCCLAAYHLINQLKLSFAEELAAKILVTCALTTSTFFSEFALNFYKNLVAASLLLWCMSYLLAGKKRIALLFFCLAFFTHKSVALVGAIYLLVYLALGLAEKNRRKEAARNILLFLSSAVAVAFLFVLLFLFHFPKASAFLAFAENSFAAPGARLHWWKDLILHHRQRSLEVSSWIFTLAVLACSFRNLKPSERQIFLTLTGLFLFSVHPFQPASASALGYRLLLLLPLLIIPMAILAYARTKGALRYLPIFALIISMLPNFSPFAFSYAAVKKEIRPYSSLKADVEKIPSFVNRNDLLISHHGMEFFVDYITDIRSRSFLADPGFTGRQFRLVYMAPDWLKRTSAGDDIDQVKLLDIGRNYFLLEEEDWRIISNENGLPGSWKNPSHTRPAHVYE